MPQVIKYFRADNSAIFAGAVIAQAKDTANDVSTEIHVTPPTGATRYFPICPKVNYGGAGDASFVANSGNTIYGFVWKEYSEQLRARRFYNPDGGAQWSVTLVFNSLTVGASITAKLVGRAYRASMVSGSLVLTYVGDEFENDLVAGAPITLFVAGLLGADRTLLDGESLVWVFNIKTTAANGSDAIDGVVKLGDTNGDGRWLIPAQELQLEFPLTSGLSEATGKTDSARPAALNVGTGLSGDVRGIHSALGPVSVSSGLATEVRTTRSVQSELKFVNGIGASIKVLATRVWATVTRSGLSATVSAVRAVVEKAVNRTGLATTVTTNKAALGRANTSLGCNVGIEVEFGDPATTWYDRRDPYDAIWWDSRTPE